MVSTSLQLTNPLEVEMYYDSSLGPEAHGAHSFMRS